MGRFCSNDECSNWESFIIMVFLIFTIYITYVDYNIIKRHNSIYKEKNFKGFFEQLDKSSTVIGSILAVLWTGTYLSMVN